MKAKQWQEIRSMSIIELDSKLRSAKEELFRMKFRHSSAPIKNGLVIRNIRRNIARYKTLLNQKSNSTNLANSINENK